MSMLLDALGYGADLLDKPGRAVRGLLGGRPEELAALLPFSDSLGLSDKANRVSGEDLTGLDDGSLLSTLGNMGAEVATDPLMFAGGALGRMLGGRASAAAVARGPRYQTTADDLLKMGHELDSGGTMARVKSFDRTAGELSTPVVDDFGVTLGPTEGGRRFNPHKLDDYQRVEYDAATSGARRSPEEWAAIANDPARVKNAMEMERGTVGAVNKNTIEDVGGISNIDNGGEGVRSLLNNYGAEKYPADLARLLSEIHPNSKMLGAGRESVAFRAPSGEVTRIDLGKTGSAYPGRPISPGMLPANSTLDVGNLGRVERVPFAENVNDFDHFRKQNPQTMRTPVDEVDRALAETNLKLSDRHLSKLGTHNGSPVALDHGSVHSSIFNPRDPDFSPAIDLFTGQRSPVTQASDPGRLMTALLNGVGADDAVRRAYASGLSGPSFGRKFGGYGAAAGADTGILARMLAGE